jgi:SAM-dependent methyltransferase
MDVGSSAGSFRHSRFGHILQATQQASAYVTVDINRNALPSVVADAHGLPFCNDTFDIVIANNLIEHLRSPEIGISEIRRVLKPAGLVLFTTPFLYPIHEAPHDFVRFTKFGLQHLFRDFTAVEILERGGWFSAVSNLIFKLTHALDPVFVGEIMRWILYLPLWGLVQLDRFDNSGAFTRVYYGTLIK